MSVHFSELLRNSITFRPKIIESNLYKGKSSSLTKYQQGQKNWIETVFEKRECVAFIVSYDDPKRCCCGRKQSEHAKSADSVVSAIPINNSEHWSYSKHTGASPTDAYGVIEFQGGAHPIKAQYLRLSYDTRPELVIQLLTRRWELELPKLLISVHGGRPNFELQPKLKKILNKGLLKAAKTTGAWIFTGGTNTGVNKHVGETFVNERSPTLRGRVVTIGIAPWGIVQNKEDLIGKEITVPYHSIPNPKSRFTALNNRHAYFLLVDNGTVEKYGAEIALRKKLEKFISRQKILTSSYSNGGRASLLTTNLHCFHNSQRNSAASDNGKACNVPVVGLIIEGGKNTIRTVLEYVTDTPPVPVVICDGSGRAADLLAFTYKYIDSDGNLNDILKSQLLVTIEKTFDCELEHADRLLLELIQCVKRKELITVFRMGEGPCQELDQAILIALLKGSRLNPLDQLSLALTWNRVDIARAEIFVYGQEWRTVDLEQAMMDALANDSVDFTKLLLENGVNLAQFLTVSRLQLLYNTKQGPSNSLRYILKDVKKNVPPSYQFTIYDIGLIIQKLMGGAYSCEYCRRRYRVSRRQDNRRPSENVCGAEAAAQCTSNFTFPYNELLVWAVLMKRQKMALFMWQQGEEAIAKALMAIKLYKAMAHEAAEDDLETDVTEQCLGYAREFETLSLELLDYCYQQSNDIAQQILTCELQNWGKQTCITLAVAAKHMEFLAHPCCQIILANLWMGGMRMRRNTNLKVLLGLLFPPFILSLEFKSQEELQLMPKTEEEHREDLESLNDLTCPDENGNKDSEGGEYADVVASHQIINRVKKDNNGDFLRDTYSSAQSVDLRFSKKIEEFYNAPITKFWTHTLAYVVFLTIFTHVVICKLAPEPSPCEWYVFAFLLVWGAEIVGELKHFERASCNRLFSLWLEKKMNVTDLSAIILFLVGFFMRFSSDNEVFMTGRVLLCIDIVYWYIRICAFLSVTKYFGPVITMIGKMVIHMSYFVVLLMVVLMAFGVLQQSILFPYEEPSWDSVRQIMYKPYFMVYGEVFADAIYPECGDNLDVKCVHGRWLVPIFMSAYLLVADILLVNLLIAIFNNVFINVNAVAHKVWKFQRFAVVMEYEQKPFLPPPLTILWKIYTLYKYCVNYHNGKKDVYDNSLKLFLCEEALEQIRDYEEECVEGFMQEKDMRYKMTSEHLVRNVYRRTECDAQKLEDLRQRETLVSNSIHGVNVRLAKLEDVCEQAVSTMAVIHRFMATQSNAEREDVEMMLDSNDLLDTSTDANEREQHYITSFNGDAVDGYEDDDDDEENDGTECTRSVDQLSVVDVGKDRSGSIRSMPRSYPNSTYTSRRNFPTATMRHGTMEGNGAAKRLVSSKHLGFKSPSRSVPNSAYNSKRRSNRAVDKLKLMPERCPVPRHIPLRTLSVRGPRKFYSGLERKSRSLAQLPLSREDQAPKGLGTHASMRVKWEEPSIQIIPATPTIPAMKHGYTSITDYIESACIPRLQASPTKSNASSCGNKLGAGKVRAARSISLSDTEQAILAERENLCNAEDSDYQLMESLIQRRLHRDSKHLSVSLEELCSIASGSEFGSSEINVGNCAQPRVLIIETDKYEISPSDDVEIK